MVISGSENAIGGQGDTLPAVTSIDRAAHWDAVFAGRDPETVSWFQADPATSLALIGRSEGADSILDVGGGATGVGSRLTQSGHDGVTILDCSPAAIESAKQKLGTSAYRARWVVADITSCVFDEPFDLWHDRAVFHFLVDELDRARYVANARSTIRDGGTLIVATFADDGPERCSGLPVRRHSEEDLRQAFKGFSPEEFVRETHVTPSGAEQHFIYGRFTRR